MLVHGDKSLVLDYGTRQDNVSIDRLKPAFVVPMTPIEVAKRAPRGRPPSNRRGDEIWPPRQSPGTLYSPLTGAGGGSLADWPTGQSLFLMSHSDVSLVNILLSITRVSLVQNKFVFCQLRVHYNFSQGKIELFLPAVVVPSCLAMYGPNANVSKKND